MFNARVTVYFQGNRKCSFLPGCACLYLYWLTHFICFKIKWWWWWWWTCGNVVTIDKRTEQELEHRPPSSTVSGRHDPLIVDKTSTAEMSAIILQRNHPRPAVRHRFHSADYTRARARFYSRQAAVACMRHIEEISFVTGRIGYMFLVLCNRRNWYHNNHINHCLCYGSRSQKHGKLDNLIGYQCCANCEVGYSDRVGYLTKSKRFRWWLFLLK